MILGKILKLFAGAAFLLFPTVSWTSAQSVADSTVTINNVMVVGNETTKEYVILREMTQTVGAVLDSAALQADQKKIYSLQLFNKVDVHYTLEGRHATVIVRVSERWYIFPIPIFGFKYRDLKKPYYGAALIHQNFRGRNEKLMASAVFGYDGWFNLAYENPRVLPENDILLRGAVGYHHVRNQNTAEGEYDQQVFTSQGTLGKRIGLSIMVLGTVGYDQWGVSGPPVGRTASPTGKDRFVTLGASFSYDHRDIREYPLSGSYVSVSAKKFGLGSAVDLFRTRIDLRGYESLVDDISLCGQALGSFLSGGVAPPYMRAYFGYEDRIRGYFRDVLEGDDLMEGSIELRLPILKPRYRKVSVPFLPPEFSLWRYGLYAGIFADAGTIWNRHDRVFTMPWYAGWGAGLHFLLPYSLVVRTEYAFNQKGRGEFVLDFGASF